jgi:hypothetical protein
VADQTVTFSRSLYRIDGIEAAAAAYAALAQITVTPGESEIVVDLTQPHPDIPPDELRDAFCNHALFETVRLHREVVGGAL